MSFLYYLLQGAVLSALRDKIMPTNQHLPYQLPMSKIQKYEHDTTNTVVKATKKYSKTKIQMNHEELANTLLDILCKDKVLKEYSIKEYGQGCNHFKITEDEKVFLVSITVCASKEDEEKIKHRMNWILYCLPYVKQQPVDFTVDKPYIPFADGNGCMFF